MRPIPSRRAPGSCPRLTLDSTVRKAAPSPTMRTPTRTALLALLLMVSARGAAAQTNLATYVSIGDSLADGVSSGSLVESHQAFSVPALIARQAGVRDFEQPLISQPGIPAELALFSIAPSVVIAPKSDARGAPLDPNLAR